MGWEEGYGVDPKAVRKWKKKVNQDKQRFVQRARKVQHKQAKQKSGCGVTVFTVGVGIAMVIAAVKGTI